MSEKKDVKLSVDQIPVEGALGLLALGDVGIQLWREARMKKGDNYHIISNNQNTKIDEQKEGK